MALNEAHPARLPDNGQSIEILRHGNRVGKSESKATRKHRDGRSPHDVNDAA
jgi:hypothetical protein